MDARAVAHALEEIATLLELGGRAAAAEFRAGARTMASLQGADLAALAPTGDLGRVRGLTPAVRAEVEGLLTHGSSDLLDTLREDTPEGLVEMLRLPGLGPARIRQLHEGLGIETLQELEEAARDGRLAQLPRFGDALAGKVRRGIARSRGSGTPRLLPHAQAEGRHLLAWLGGASGVVDAALAGTLRRGAELVADFDVVVTCDGPPDQVLAALAHGPRVVEAAGTGGRLLTVRLEGDLVVRVHGATRDEAVAALWRATGSEGHVADVCSRLAARGLALVRDRLRDADGRPVPLPDERALYAAAGLAWVPPERREGRGEVAVAAAGPLPPLVGEGDIRGVLHCHSGYSDGASQLSALADAAAARGWAYVGVTDHSQSNPHAGGMTPDDIRRQHDEIDAINASRSDMRLLKGVEADILPCGRLDYDERQLEAFDYVIGSVHTRFGMNRAQMTERVLKALDQPALTVLGHPTGRLLLTREPYAIDLEAVLAKAGTAGVAVELNADPHRMDLDWRWLDAARTHRVTIELAPDAHTPAGFDHMALAVTMARKGGLTPADVLNARDVGGVLAFARGRRSVAVGR